MKTRAQCWRAGSSGMRLKPYVYCGGNARGGTALAGSMGRLGALHDSKHLLALDAKDTLDALATWCLKKANGALARRTSYNEPAAENKSAPRKEQGLRATRAESCLLPNTNPLLLGNKQPTRQPGSEMKTTFELGNPASSWSASRSSFSSISSPPCFFVLRRQLHAETNFMPQRTPGGGHQVRRASSVWLASLSVHRDLSSSDVIFSSPQYGALLRARVEQTESELAALRATPLTGA